MAFVGGNADFSSVLSHPAAVSALLFATLKRVLAEDGEAGLAEGVLSVSEKDNVVCVRADGPLVASALRLRASKIESAFSEALARFWRGGELKLRIR